MREETVAVTPARNGRAGPVLARIVSPAICSRNGIRLKRLSTDFTHWTTQLAILLARFAEIVRSPVTRRVRIVTGNVCRNNARPQRSRRKQAICLARSFPPGMRIA